VCEIFHDILSLQHALISLNYLVIWPTFPQCKVRNLYVSSVQWIAPGVNLLSLVSEQGEGQCFSLFPP